VEKSLAAVPAASISASLAALGEPDIEATLARVARNHNGHATGVDDDPGRTSSLSVGGSTSDGQRFRLLRPYAQGGLGEVFVALDAELHREVAVKQILEKHADDPASRQRFVAEAEITGGLEHPGVVPVYGLGTYDGGRPYYAMRFIKGESLKAAIEHFHGDDTLKSNPGRHALELRKLLRRFLDVCNAVDYAHSRGVIHRDLKPANIILGRHGETLVVDWGVAKAIGRADPSVGEQTIAPSSSGSSETLPGSALGTPAYMSPEQAGGDLDRLGPRSDVYSLGATLYCLLTGKPPFECEDMGEVLRKVQAGAFRAPRAVNPALEKVLEAVCTKAMATTPQDRYASCRALAEDVERWAADEPVTAYPEPWARTLVRWVTRHRTGVTGVAAAVLAGVVGLAAVLAVQAQANAQLSASLKRETKAKLDLASANAKLSDEHTKVEARNRELSDEQAKVQARFELAQKAIATFHTGVSEDMLLKNAEFKELRTKLLKEAAGFYDDLKKLLAGQTDVKSRKALAAAYFQLAELTDKTGDKREALAAHRQALALRRELAAAEGADVETRLDVVRSLGQVGVLLSTTGDNAGALAALDEQRHLTERLEAEHPTDAVRSVLAKSQDSIGLMHFYLGEGEKGLADWRKALAIQQKLADANPAVTEFQRDLATSQHRIALMLQVTGKPEEAMASYRKALAIRQKLADANPAVAQFQRDLAATNGNMGVMLVDAGTPEEALLVYRKALAIFQKLADANPAVTQFQDDLALGLISLGIPLLQTGRPEEPLRASRKALAIFQKLADANPADIRFQHHMALTYGDIGWCLLNMGKPVEAAEAERKASDIMQKLLADNPANREFQGALATSQNNIGRALDRQKRLTEAFSALETGLAIRQQLAKADPNNAGYSGALGSSYGNRGGARVRAGSADGGAEAATDLRRALELWAKVPHPDLLMQVERSRALALLAGLGGYAKSGVTKDEARTFADRSVAALADAIKAGWALPSELKEPDFDAVRGRDDFRKLVAEVEAKASEKARLED
jgi:serine/threonine-protein kinase